MTTTIKNKPKCGRLLDVQRYGGGMRFCCPHCDVRRNDHGMLMSCWTNASPPQDQRCIQPA